MTPYTRTHTDAFVRVMDAAGINWATAPDGSDVALLFHAARKRDLELDLEAMRAAEMAKSLAEIQAFLRSDAP